MIKYINNYEIVITVLYPVREACANIQLSRSEQFCGTVRPTFAGKSESKRTYIFVQ
jgi:hypothetical protein